MSITRAYAAQNAKAALAAAEIRRREPGPHDVEMDILYCGVCHSDLHTARGEWAVWPTIYPCVPGHEIVGRVTRIGPKVTRHKVGDLVAVGCMVDSCGTCASCKIGLEQYCDTGSTIFTYNSRDPIGTAEATYGGYSERIVVTEKFVLRVSDKLKPAAVRPVALCGHNAIFAAEALACRAGKEGGDRGPGRPGTHGGEVFPCVRGAHGVVHDVGVKGGGWEAAGR